MNETFADYVKEQQSRNPCLHGLVEFLADIDGRQVHPVNFFSLDCSQNKFESPRPWNLRHSNGSAQSTGATTSTPLSASKPLSLEESNESSAQTVLREMMTIPPGKQGRVILIENIDRHTVSYLGALYGISPLFFATHIDNIVHNFEDCPPPPVFATSPSRFCGQDWVNLHYQRVLDISEGPDPGVDTLYFNSNITQRVKILASLSGRRIALARSCCSVIKTSNTANQWICIILVDANKADAVSRDTNSNKISWKQVPLQGGPEDFVNPPPFSVWNAARAQEPKRLRSSGNTFEPLIKKLVDFLKVLPPAFNASNPSLHSLAYYPLRVVISEWMFYSLLLSRYVQHYEYTLISFKSSLGEADLRKLQPWRRRCIRSQQRLDLLRMFIQEYTKNRHNVRADDVWDHMLNDVNHISKQITHWASFLNSMVPLLNTHQSLVEAQDVRRLTYLVLIFVPFSLIASIFSMADKVLPWGSHFWLYFTVSVPFTVLILALSALLPRILNVLKL